MSPPRSNKPAKRASARRRPATGRDFWGTDDEVTDKPVDVIRPTDAPVAMVTSLGRPPLPGHEAAAERYFEAVYARAVALSIALAAANDLLETEADNEADDGELLE